MRTMNVLQRLTTRYDPVEDRLQITGMTGNGQTLTLWITQRLLNRLVVHLCDSLERMTLRSGDGAEGGYLASLLSTRTHLEQSFAQQKARAALSVQQPVVADQDAPQWRVDVVDCKQVPGGMHLVLKGAADGQLAALTLPAVALRQWLAVLYELYQQGNWPMQVWPAWMEEAAAARQHIPQANVFH